MAKTSTKKPVKQRERARAKAFRPIAIEIGCLTYEWNRLHEALGVLFGDIVLKENPSIPLAVWHSLTNERAQREMLKAAIRAAFEGHSPKPRTHDDIDWILEHLNKALAGRRNDAIHPPLVFVHEFNIIFDFVEQIRVMPNYYLGSLRARQLKDKSLLEEFRWYRDHISRLANFAEGLHCAICSQDCALPDRPDLPPRGHFANRAPKRSKNTSK
jgi:hypothetical protein